LISKCSEIAGELADLKKQLKAKEADLSAVDHSIKLFDPDFDLRTIKDKRVIQRVSNPLASTRAVMDALRGAETGKTLDEIAQTILSESTEEYDLMDKAQLKHSLSKILNKLKNKRRVTRIDGYGWKIAS